jgi:diketogulonate reductase-like aldo/keto reductase
MILEETYTLSNGIEIPKLGLGSWFIDNANAASAVKEAAKIGYRHIDTAQAYGNEEGVGEGSQDQRREQRRDLRDVQARCRGQVL